MEYTPTATVIKIGVIDDHLIFTLGLVNLLNTKPGFKAVLGVTSGEDLLEQLAIKTERPDVLLMDISMYRMDGIEATREVKALYPSIKVIAISSLGAEYTIINMIHAGACAYLKKDVHPVELEHAIREVYYKGIYHSDMYHRKARQASEENRISFTEKEIRFLQLSSTEMTYKEIAIELNLGPDAIDYYRKNMFEKLEVTTRVTMVLEAIRRDLIELH